MVIDVLLAPLQPRRRLAAVANLGEGPAWAIVGGTAALSVGLQVLADNVSAAGRSLGPGNRHHTASLLVAPLLIAYWLASGVVVDATARQMGAPSARRSIRRLSSCAFPILLGFALVRLAQSALDRGGNLAASLSVPVGLTTLVFIGWYVVVNAVAVSIVYSMPSGNAALVALAPFAAVSGLLLAFVVIASALQAAGIL